jgi:8-oxo-dGTP pyrophosphatase MutT (NUDIX family)
MNYKKAGALILNADMDKCLMVFQKSSLLWGIPKGQLEENEDCYICMIREVKEEVGLNLNNLKFEILESTTIHYESYIYIIKLLLDPLPICSPPFEEGNDNHEIEKIEWVKLEDAYKRKNNSITVHALHKLKKHLSFKKKSLPLNIKENYHFPIKE